MLFRVARIRRILRRSRLALLAGACLLVISSAQVLATDSSINVGVSGSPAPALDVTNVSSPVTATTMPLAINGTVSSLTQIQIYVDGAYSSTIPLTPDATSFSYSLNLNQGTHSVEFLGISAYTTTNPSVTLSITYTPASSGGGTTNPPSDSGGKPSGPDGVVIGGEPVENGNNSGISGVDLPNWLYQPLVFFDIINPSRATDTSSMLGRFVWVVVALFLIIFARPTLYLYRKVRYDWLHLDKRPLLYILRQHPLFWIRTLGVAIVIAVFIWS